MGSTWGDKPAVEILADIQSALSNIWSNVNSDGPTTIHIPWRNVKLIQRATLSKRAFRRWRGSLKAKGLWAEPRNPYWDDEEELLDPAMFPIRKSDD